METISDQIPAIQQSMVSLWGLYSADQPKAERDFQAAVADLKVQIYARVQENSNAASFFAPIRRLPVPFGGGGNNHSTLKLARTSQFWRAVIFSMPGICLTPRLSSRTKADNCNFFWSRGRSD